MVQVEQGLQTDRSEEPHQVPAGCNLTHNSPFLVFHLRAPLLVHVRAPLHENRDRFVVLVRDRQAQNGLVFLVTAVGICSLQRVEKDKLAQSLSSVAPARHPSKYNKPLMELNCFNSNEAGTPRPSL